MASLVRLTAQLQQLALRLSGLLLSCLLGIYLVAWATDPPGVLLNLLCVLALFGSIIAHGVAHFRGRSVSGRFQIDLGLFSALTVACYAVLLQLPGGLDGAFYPLIYVLMMAGAAYSRPAATIATVFFAGLLEFGLRVIALGQPDWDTVWPRLLFLALFTGLNVALFRAEIARVRSLSRKHMVGELSRLKEAARSYRLASADKSMLAVTQTDNAEQALHSAVGEIQQATKYALGLLADSLKLKTAALLSLDKKGNLVPFEAHSEASLTARTLSAQEGIFSAALSRRQPITVVGKRASHHANFYAEPQEIGALAVLPLLEQEKPRAFLVVTREDQTEFSASDVARLDRSGRFLLRTMQNERVFARLDRANREQAKLYRAASALGSARTEAQVIEVGVECAREVAAFDFAAVTLFHRKGSTHEICAVSGDNADHLLGQTFRHNAGLVSMSVANRHALPYKGHYEPSRQIVFSRGHEPPKMPSLLVLPLLVHERVLGTLVLGSNEQNAFSHSVRPALEVLASHMAVSLSNARLLKRLEEQATTDGMTGLLNKRTLISEAERRIKAATRFNKPLSLLVTDIDHFKRVNDTYGHDVGDVVIKGLGEVLRRIKRDTDVVGRFGGEEFVIVCEQTDEEGGVNLAERIRKELENTTFQTELGPLQVTCSVGVAPFPAAGRDWETLFKATDEALYVSKRGGRNQVTVYKPGQKTTAA
jgi:diguanylate cyclase (GGDEF)-like protein